MPHQEKNAIKQFDQWAKIYDQLLFLPFNKSNMEISNRIRPRSGDSILDIGCGTGILIEQLLSKKIDLKLFGIDISPNMVEKAKNKFVMHKEVEITEGTASKLPFNDSSFDYVTCATSFHHHPDPKQSLSEMYRVLKRGGVLYLLDPCNTGLARKMINTFLNVILSEGETFIFTNDEMKKMFELAGFTDIQQKHQWYYRLLTMGIKK